MRKSKFTDAQISFILKQADEGTSVAEVCRKAGIAEATFYNWRKKYAGLIPSEMKRFKRLAGLPLSLRLHDLRHTYASHALLLGESLFTTGKLLGHANTNSTARYAHLAPDMLAQAADQCAIRSATSWVIFSPPI